MGAIDGFARDNLPPRELWPEFLLDRPEFQYPERLNAVSVLLDRWVLAGHGEAPCLIGATRGFSYAGLAGP